MVVLTIFTSQGGSWLLQYRSWCAIMYVIDSLHTLLVYALVNCCDCAQ